MTATSMSQPIRKQSTRGSGQCGRPDCVEPKAPNRHVCRGCAGDYDRIRKELEEDPKLLYHQRSDSERRVYTDESGKTKKRPTTPTCRLPGCFQERVPPDIYCDGHRDMGSDD